MDNICINVFDYFDWQHGQFDQTNLLSRTRHTSDSCCGQEIAEEEKSFFRDLLSSRLKRHLSNGIISDRCDFDALPSLIEKGGFPVNDFKVKKSDLSISCSFVSEGIPFFIHQSVFPSDARGFTVSIMEQEISVPSITEQALASFFLEFLKDREGILNSLSGIRRSYLKKIDDKNDIRERVCVLIEEYILGRCRFIVEEYKDATRVMIYPDDIMTIKLEIPLDGALLEKLEEDLKRLVYLLGIKGSNKEMK